MGDSCDNFSDVKFLLKQKTLYLWSCSWSVMDVEMNSILLFGSKVVWDVCCNMAICATCYKLQKVLYVAVDD